MELWIIVDYSRIYDRVRVDWVYTVFVLFITDSFGDLKANLVFWRQPNYTSALFTSTLCLK